MCDVVVFFAIFLMVPRLSRQKYRKIGINSVRELSVNEVQEVEFFSYGGMLDIKNIILDEPFLLSEQFFTKKAVVMYSVNL